MSTPTYASSGAWNGSGGATTKSFAVPAGVAVDDVIIIPMFIDGSTVTITGMPAGFQHAPNSPQTVNPGGAGNHSINVVWKRATGADTGTYDFTFSSATYEEGQAHRYTGCTNVGSPWDVTTSASSGATATSVTPAVSVTTSGANELLFFAGTNWSGGAWTPPTGFTERTDHTSDLTADDFLQVTAGSSGTVQATCTGTDRSGAWLGALTGAPPVLPPPGNIGTVRPRWLPRWRRSKLVEPAWPQANRGQAWPSVTVQPGTRPKWLPKLRRAKSFEPPWPQGPQTTWTPTYSSPRRSVTTRPVRRAHWFEPPWPQAPLVIRTLVLTLGKVFPKWLIDAILPSAWVLGAVGLKWEVGELEVTSISSQSLEYVRVGPVTAQVNGVVVNPTADVVKMAFLASSAAAPGPSDWKTATWNTVGVNQYQIQCLVGTGGATQLTAGYWYVWIQITDSPEVIVRSVDIIQVTA